MTNPGAAAALDPIACDPLPQAIMARIETGWSRMTSDQRLTAIRLLHSALIFVEQEQARGPADHAREAIYPEVMP